MRTAPSRSLKVPSLRFSRKKSREKNFAKTVARTPDLLVIPKKQSIFPHPNTGLAKIPVGTGGNWWPLWPGQTPAVINHQLLLLQRIRVEMESFNGFGGEGKGFLVKLTAALRWKQLLQVRGRCAGRGPTALLAKVAINLERTEVQLCSWGPSLGLCRH